MNKKIWIIGSVVLLAGMTAYTGFALFDPKVEMANPNDMVQVALGQQVYADNCASCHGDKLEGQPNWRSFNDDGTLPAPPHDDSGHTWHHDDQLLFNYTKKGGRAMIPGDFRSGMPGYGEALNDDEIWAVLAFIKSRWSEKALARQKKMTETAIRN